VPAAAGRRRALLLALWLCASGCLGGVVVGGGVAPGPARPAAGDSPNLAVARRFFEALGALDTEAIAELYAEDIEVWVGGSLPFSGTYNREQAMRGVAALRDTFPRGLEFTLRGSTEQGERLALEVESRGVHVSGRPYHNQYHYLLVIRGGKIQAIREYFDTLQAQQILVVGGAGER
jgi:ketosteroid isomerase-like protein